MYIPRVDISTRPVYDSKTGCYVDTENDYEMTMQDMVISLNTLIDIIYTLNGDVVSLQNKVTILEIENKSLTKEFEQLRSKEFSASKKLVRAAKCRRITKEEDTQVKS